jgi:hypothetical protein
MGKKLGLAFGCIALHRMLGEPIKGKSDEEI